MKLRVTYTIVLDVDEDKAPAAQEALEVAAKAFDPNSGVDETDCEELTDED